jgi:hypothetical protein
MASRLHGASSGNRQRAGARCEALCSFDVLLHYTVNQEYAKTWTYSDGSQRVSFNGNLALDSTNLATGTTIKLERVWSGHATCRR